jgi:nitrite reductase/ring-hydroxylating ferredoxin subunit
MLTPEDNERICRVGPGTPAGTFFRRYWLPALLSEEVPEDDGAPVRVRLLGEDLIAYRDTTGAVGLVDAFCPHRRAPMFFGRNEDCGLRCVYHGWKFDRNGACVEMPSEPPDSLFKTKVTIGAYPTYEAGGIVWAYLGPREHEPAPPDFELCRAPASHRVATKTLQECNYLQALEGGIDSVHSGFLHCNDIHDRKLLRNNRCEVEYDLTPYGIAGAAIHPLDGDRIYARTFHFVMPIHSIRGRHTDRRGGDETTPTITGQTFVPIDDLSCWLYSYEISSDPARPLSSTFLAERAAMWGRDDGSRLPGYRLTRNIRNDYLVDRALQRSTSYSGMVGMNVQDIALQEGMGAICDRSKEHLAYSDAIIIAQRRLLFAGIDAVARGESPQALDPAVYRAVRGYDRVLPAGADWRDTYRDALVARF